MDKLKLACLAGAKVTSTKLSRVSRMDKVKQAIATIEEGQAMTCSCGFCKADRWAYELAITALRKLAEEELGSGSKNTMT